MSWSWEVIMYKTISKIASRDSLSLGIHVLTWSPLLSVGWIYTLASNEWIRQYWCMSRLKLGYKKTVTSDTPPSVSVFLSLSVSHMLREASFHNVSRPMPPRSGEERGPLYNSLWGNETCQHQPQGWALKWIRQPPLSLEMSADQADTSTLTSRKTLSQKYPAKLLPETLR